MAKYVTHENTVNMVDNYLNTINCVCIEAEIILESYLIRYQSENILENDKLDKKLLVEILKLHKNLESSLIDDEELREKLLNYTKLYKKWFKMDEERIIKKMIKDYHIYEENKKEPDLDEDEYLSISYAQKEIKHHLFSIGGKDVLKRIKTEMPNYEEDINYLIKQLEKNYCKIIEDSILKGDMDIVKKNLKDLRGLLLILCDKDEKMKKEVLDDLFIEYLSDESIYSYLLKVIEYVKKFADEDISIKIKETERTLKYNVIKDKEMHEFLPGSLDNIFSHIEYIIIKKKLDINKIESLNYFMDLLKDKK